VAWFRYLFCLECYHDSALALEPAIDLAAWPDVRDVEDFGIDCEDDSIVAHSRGSAIYTNQRFREPCGLWLRRDNL